MRPLLLLLGASVLAVQPAADLAIRDVRVIHGGGPVTATATILVRSGRIVAVDASAARNRHPARRSIDGRRLTVLPGLIDAHVHVAEWTLPLFLRWGVTTVRDLHNDPAYIFALARDDSPRGPHVVAAGAAIDGHESLWPDAIQVATVRQARAAVRRQVDEGAGVIAVSTRLAPPLLEVVVNEARARGLPVAAHVGRSTARDAAAVGVGSLEHLSGIAEAATQDMEPAPALHEDVLASWAMSERRWLRARQERLAEVARSLRDAAVAIVPALVLHESVSQLADAGRLQRLPRDGVPASVLENEWNPREIMRAPGWTTAALHDLAAAIPLMQRFVASFVHEGGRVVGGTDAPRHLVAPGEGLHRELQLYVAAGLTPAAALKAATTDAAELLGVSHRAGTIAVGKDADMLVVEGDPLSDIRATMRIRYVVRQGLVVHER